MDIKSEERVQIRFTVNGEFTDALYFTPAEREALTPEGLDQLKADRYNAWKAVVAAPARPPSEEDLAAALEAKVQEKERLDAELALVDPVMLEAAYDRLGLVKGDGLDVVGEVKLGGAVLPKKG